MNKTILILGIAISAALGAFGVNHPWHYQTDIINEGMQRVTTQWRIVDKGWRPRMKPGKKWDGEFLPYDETHDKWVLVSTNDIVRPMSVKSRSVYRDTVTNLEHTVSILEPDAKKQKDLEKAAKKFGKNLDKERKNFEKYRDKAGTEEEKNFWQALLDVLPVPNAEGK